MKPVKPVKTETVEYWAIEIENFESDEHRNKWLDLVKDMEEYLDIQLESEKEKEKDIVNLVGSFLRRWISLLPYQAPVPMVHCALENKKYGEVIRYLTQKTFEESQEKQGAQQILKDSLISNLGIRKVHLRGGIPCISRIRPQDILFNASFLTNGGTPIEDAQWVGHKAEKTLQRILLEEGYDKSGREELKAFYKLPYWSKTATLYEIYYNTDEKDDEGEVKSYWNILTLCRPTDAEGGESGAALIKLQDERAPHNLLPFAFCRYALGGKNYLNGGIISELRRPHNELNTAFKRVISKVNKGVDILFYSDEIGKRTKEKISAKRLLSSGVNAIQLTTKGMKSIDSMLREVHLGTILSQDLEVIKMIYEWSLFVTQTTPSAFSQQAASVEKTATEVTSIMRLFEEQLGAYTQTIDGALDRTAYLVSVLWADRVREFIETEDLKHPLWQFLSNEQIDTVLKTMTIKNAKDEEIQKNIFMQFSEQLTEFTIDIVPKSYTRNYKLQQAQNAQILLSVATSQGVQEQLFMEKKRLKVAAIIEQLISSLTVDDRISFIEAIPEDEWAERVEELSQQAETEPVEEEQRETE